MKASLFFMYGLYVWVCNFLGYNSNVVTEMCQCFLTDKCYIGSIEHELLSNFNEDRIWNRSWNFIC